MELDTVVVGNCLDIMKDMSNQGVDVVITDPPFGTKTKNWDIEPTEEMWKEIRRVGKDMFAVFGYPANLMRWSHYFDDLKLIGYIVWVKYNELVPSAGLTRAHQDIAIWGDNIKQVKADRVREDYTFKKSIEKFFANPGKDGLSKRLAGAKIHQRGRRCTDVWVMPAPGHGFNAHLRNHPNEKPLVALERLVRLLSESGNIIFDPFAGSGTTLVAALKLNRHFYGCDTNPEYVGIANKRIEKARLEMAQMEMDLTRT